MPHSIPAPPPSAPLASGGTRALPPYQAPLHPLSQTALDQLAQLRATEYPVKTLNDKYKDAISALGQDGADISERLVERRQLIARNQGRRQRDGKDDATLDAAEAAELADLELKVTRMTQRMEDAVRRAIDGRVAVEQLQAAHADAAREANTHSSSTQQTLLQSQAGQTQVTVEGATPAATQPLIPPKELFPFFGEHLESAQDRYQARSLYQRYAEHNEYIGFKRIIHAASYPEEEAPPLSHASTWFVDAEPQPGVTATAREDDDDLVISRAHISTKCPLTLREFENPVTSTKCPHSFEKTAIMDMIRAQRPPTRRAGERNSGWQQQTQCPVPGCHQMLGKDDLERDEVLVRRIKRIQRAKELEEEEAGARVDGHGDSRMGMADEIDSDSGDDVDAVTQSQTAANVKREALSQARSALAADDEINDEEDDG